MGEGIFIFTIFFSVAPKILGFIELRVRDMAWDRQNLEPQGLRGKILRNKELAVPFRAADSGIGWVFAHIPNFAQ